MLLSNISLSSIAPTSFSLQLVQKTEFKNHRVNKPGRSVSCEDLTPVNKEQFTLEDSDVTLSYKYSRQADARDYFFWYRQYPGKPPELLISHSASGQVAIPHLRYKIKVENKQIYKIIISSAAVSDSAVYYCAVRPTVTGNSTSLYKNLWSKDNTILHNVH
ncbi:hypothetical protein Q5P01_022983 [Channa striata]|uniref:Immunoglobulin V-set domain-containing protein n=1 Tax=Channa striata TaxID=64152 RepID=A0AA88LRZ8_CHASR|nr:hypothetical protein Q5P01_022983 [Channa striata]